MRALLLPNQRRIHFKDERIARKNQIISTIERSGVTALAYAVRDRLPEIEARAECLRHLVADLSRLGATRLVLEQDDSLVVHDRRVLFDAIGKAGCAGELDYVHARAFEECLLWIPDALAWCWTHRGPWRDRVRHLVSSETV